MGWLAGITAVDLDIKFEAGKHFTAVQEMTEEFRQEVQYQGAFRHDGPVLRRKRRADEATLSFSCILLKSGISGEMNNEDLLKDMEDFEITTIRGNSTQTYKGCNWNRISIRSTLDQCTLDADVSVPGYAAPYPPGVGAG